LTELPTWLKVIPVLLLTAINVLALLDGTVWPWGIALNVLAIVILIATAGKKSDYNF
jgi:hypothetical protein